MLPQRNRKTLSTKTWISKVKETTEYPVNWNSILDKKGSLKAPERKRIKKVIYKCEWERYKVSDLLEIGEMMPSKFWKKMICNSLTFNLVGD